MSVDHISTFTLAQLGAIAHVGHVVRDLDAVMAEYTQQLGVSWAPVAEYGRGRRGSRFTCSRGGEFQIELIQEVPGSIWSVADGTPFHHLAFWSDSLPAQLDLLAAQGLALEASGPTFGYLRGAGGLRIELMDRALKPAWDGWLDGGRLFG